MGTVVSFPGGKAAGA